MRKWIAMCAVCLGAWLHAEPVKVIFDTDMYTDFDDVGALACLHALADEGKCEILATVSSTRGTPSVGVCQAINAWYGRGDIPVGAPRESGSRRQRRRATPIRSTSGWSANDLNVSNQATTLLMRMRFIVASWPDSWTAASPSVRSVS